MAAAVELEEKELSVLCADAGDIRATRRGCFHVDGGYSHNRNGHHCTMPAMASGSNRIIAFKEMVRVTKPKEKKPVLEDGVAPSEEQKTIRYVFEHVAALRGQTNPATSNTWSKAERTALAIRLLPEASLALMVGQTNHKTLELLNHPVQVLLLHRQPNDRRVRVVDVEVARVCAEEEALRPLLQFGRVHGHPQMVPWMRRRADT